MSFISFLKSHYAIVKPILRYRKVYKNYLSVITNILRKKYPIYVIFHNGIKQSINDYYEIYLSTFGLMKYCTITDNIITLENNFPFSKIRLDLGSNGGDIYGIFFNHEYGFLPVKDRIVIDIGANIGDSSIYFALKGAKKIIALEPFPSNYHLAKKNILLNDISSKVELVLSGCSDRSTSIIVNPDSEGAGKNLQSTSHGVSIPLITLDDILNKFNIHEYSLLKMDCEGCEYDVILSASENTLRRFSHIQLEYHYGYKNIKNKLEKCGFQVTFTNPSFSINLQAKKLMYYGYIYAEQIIKT